MTYIFVEEKKGFDYKKRAEEAEMQIEEPQDEMKKKVHVMEQAVAMICGTVCEVGEMIPARHGEMDTNQQTVQVPVEDIKPQEDLCATELRFGRKKNKGSDYKKRAEETEKKIEEIQHRLKEIECEKEKLLAKILGTICEDDDKIAARR